MSRKTIAILLAVAMVASLCMTGSAMAKSKKNAPKLVKSFVEKRYDAKNKKWVKIYSGTFTYNKKGDPKKIVIKRHNSILTWVYKNAFKYKKGKKVSLKSTCTYSSSRSKVITTSTVKYNKKGLRKRMVENSKSSKPITSTYAYKKNFVSSISFKNNDEADKTKYVYKFKKGLPVKGTWSDKYGKTWSKISTATINKKGLITDKKGYIYTVLNSKYKYTYYKNGLVKNVVGTYSTIDDDNESMKTRIEFKYTKKSTDKLRYVKMINSGVRSEFGMDWY